MRPGALDIIVSIVPSLMRRLMLTEPTDKYIRVMQVARKLDLCLGRAVIQVSEDVILRHISFRQVSIPIREERSKGFEQLNRSQGQSTSLSPTLHGGLTYRPVC